MLFVAEPNKVSIDSINATFAMWTGAITISTDPDTSSHNPPVSDLTAFNSPPTELIVHAHMSIHLKKIHKCGADIQPVCTAAIISPTLCCQCV